MNTDRITQIMNQLDGLGTKKDVEYTNQEIVDKLKELQAALAKGVFEKTHAENLQDKDVMLHFEILAKEYAIDGTVTYKRFKENMHELGETISTYISGLRGEQMAKRALKPLSCDKNIRILYNVQLEDEVSQAEYDAIVIAPYGMFVIEVKNWNSNMTISSSGMLARDDGFGKSYNIPGKFEVKEALLREILRDAFPNSYMNILHIPSETAYVRDNYGKILISHSGLLTERIRMFDQRRSDDLSEEQINKIADIITANNKEQRTLCTVNCEEIISDYALLIAQIEEAASKKQEDANVCNENPNVNSKKNVTPVNDTAKIDIETEDPTGSNWYEEIEWPSVAIGFATGFATGIIAAVVSHRRR